MSVLEATTSIDTKDGLMDVFMVEPNGPGRAPGVLVLQEVFGVNGHIQNVCRKLSKEGFLSGAPELFHRSGFGVTFENTDMAGGVGEMSKLTNDGITNDLKGAIAWMRKHPRCDGRVAVIGFCVGGLAAFIGACRTDVDATISFYGAGIVHVRAGLKLEPVLGEASRISRPTICLFGGKDPSIPPEDVAAIKAELGKLRMRSEVVVYPEAGHAFFNEDRSNYHKQSADEAWKKAMRFLRGSMSTMIG